MLKKTFITLGLSIMAITTMQSGAIAGGGHGHSGYDALWWNGPAGYDHNILFTKNSRYRVHSRYKSCNSYEKKYISTGKKYWLRKYQICKADQ